MVLMCGFLPLGRAADSVPLSPSTTPAPRKVPAQSPALPLGTLEFGGPVVGESVADIPSAAGAFFGRLVVPGQAQFQPRPPGSDFEMQLALAQHQFSPGSLDGLIGPQTRAALSAFQARHGLARTEVMDEPTRRVLLLKGPPLARIVVRQEDLFWLRPNRETWLARSQADYLGYALLHEMMGELSRSHPRLIQKLNPNTDWERVATGTVLTVPNARIPHPEAMAAYIRISLGERRIQVYDGDTNLIAHFPCSIGRLANQRPVGRLEVAVIAENPNYTFDPKVFPESEEGRRLRRKLILPPGPNNPVGVAWIGLNREGYGIHGTPEPEKVGRTESHGCFRLANWNAAQLLARVWISMPVYVDP